MNDKMEFKSYEKVKRLLKLEQDNALKDYNSSLLRKDILYEIESMSLKKGREFSFLNRRVMVSFSIALFLIITSLIAFNYLSDYSFNKDFTKIERIFSVVPGLNYSKINSDSQIESGTNRELLTKLSWIIKRGIYTPHNILYSKVKLENIFLKSLSANLQSNPTSVSQIEEVEPDKLHLEERVRKLIRNRKINRFFMKLNSKKKGA
jgi:hypothetical protein